VQGGGTRASMAGPLAWETDDDQQSMVSGTAEEAAWEFDTVKVRPNFDVGGLGPRGDDNEMHSTVRPPATTKLPPTLRALFPDDTTDSDPPLSFLSSETAPTFDALPSVPPSTHPLRMEARGRSRNAITHGAADDAPTAKPPAFVFPPRPSSPSSSLRNSEHNVQDSPPQSPSHAYELDSFEFGSSSLVAGDREPVDNLTITPSYREVRLHKGLADIEIPPHSPTESGFHDSPPFTPALRLNRKRSQSSTADLASTKPQRDRNLASSMDFHFPSSVPRREPSLSRDILNVSSGNHSAVSLDAAGIPKRLPSPGSLPSHPRDRLIDENAVSELDFRMPPLSQRPNLPRLRSVGSLAATPDLPLPQARLHERDDDSIGQSHPLPALKDVLKIPSLSSEHKLGLPDLLPVTPFVHQGRTSPSNIIAVENDLSTLDFSRAEQRGLPLLNPSASSSSTSVDSFSTSVVLPSNEPNISFTPSHHSQSSGVLQTIAISYHSTRGPSITPLDFGPLTHSRDATHAQLGKTVEDLAQWLSVVEAGLTDILDVSHKDIIKEENDDDLPSTIEEPLVERETTVYKPSSDVANI